MIMLGHFKPKPEWRKSLYWHLKELFISYKVWKREKQDKHLDLGTFHCWRVNRIYKTKHGFMKYLYLIFRLSWCPHKWQLRDTNEWTNSSGATVQIRKVCQCTKCGEYRSFRV